jgi:hypothetical protein
VKESNHWQKQNFCNVDHMAAHGLEKARQQQERAKKATAKKERAEHKEAKERIKTRGDWLKECQIAFNAFIRERDAGLPCVSCGRGNNVKQNAGHYRSVGSEPSLRFCEEQVWKQCEHCNSYLSGNLINYRIELLRRIGPERLEWIEGYHEPKKYSIEDLRAIRDEYRAKLKQLRREAA